MAHSEMIQNPSSDRNLSATDILLRQRWFIIVFCFSAILFALLLTYVFSERYRAQAVILYQPIETRALRQKTTETFGAPVPPASFKVIMQTLRDTVTTEMVLRPVVEKLGLDKEVKAEYTTWYSRVFNQTKDTVKEWASDAWCLLKYGRIVEDEPVIAAMKGLAKNIDIVSSPRDSYIYVLRVKDKYPARAAAIANEVGRTLVQMLKDKQDDESRTKMEQLAQQLDAQEAKILALRQQRRSLLENNSLVSIPAETVKGLENLYQLQLKQVQLEAQINKRQQEIESYNRNITEQKITQSEDIAKMRSQKLFSEVDLRGLVAENQFTADSIKKLKAELDKMPALQNQTDVLDNEITSAIREYEILKDFHTELMAQDHTAQSETTLLAEAFVPAMPIQPIKIYHVGLTGILSLIFSVGFVFILDYIELERAKRLAALAKSGGLLAQGEKAAGLLDALAINVAAQGGSIYLKEKEQLVLAKSLDRKRAVPSVIQFPLAPESVFGQVMATGEPMVVQNIRQRDDLKSSGWDGYKDDSFMVLPIPDESGETIGLVSLHNKKKPPFVTEDKHSSLELLTSRAVKAMPKGFFSRIFRSVPILLVAAALAGIAFFILRKAGF